MPVFSGAITNGSWAFIDVSFVFSESTQLRRTYLRTLEPHQHGRRERKIFHKHACVVVWFSRARVD